MIRALLIALVLSSCQEDGPCAVTPSSLDFGEVDTLVSTAGVVKTVSLNNPSARDLLWTVVRPAPPFFVEGFAFGEVENGVLFTPRHSRRNLAVRFAPQRRVPPGSTHRVTVAGPKGRLPGSVGELRFHVMDIGRVDQSIELRSP